MIIVLILLAVVSSVAVVLAMELTQLFGRAPRIDDLPQLAVKFASQQKYQPVERLFDEADVRFLRTRIGHAAELEKRLRFSRARVMRSYMQMFRGDFHEAWSLCRLLAPFSDDPNFGVTLMKQLAKFYGLYGSIQVRMLVYAYKPGTVDISELVNALRQVRQIALQTLTVTENMAIEGSAA